MGTDVQAWELALLLVEHHAGRLGDSNFEELISLQQEIFVAYWDGTRFYVM